jgi:hypothetical protein
VAYYEGIEAFEGTVDSFKVGKIIRESNHAAHELSKLSKCFVFNSFWLGHVQAEVLSFVEDDVVKCVTMIE